MDWSHWYDIPDLRRGRPLQSNLKGCAGKDAAAMELGRIDGN
jgi:hypothetical protein